MRRSIPSIQEFINKYVGKKIKVCQILDADCAVITANTYDSYTDDMNRWSNISNKPFYVVVTYVWVSDAGIELEAVTSSGDKYVVHHNSNLPLEYVRTVSKIAK